MTTSGDFCIVSNPDISGIGVRSAIYAQNFITFIPAAYALWDKSVTLPELASLETQSTTILITAFAILLSTIVQALTPVHSVTNFHASIVLHLSWMNNTNTFIYFLLRVFHEFEENHDRNASLKRSTPRRIQLIRKALPNSVLAIGSLHISLMSGVGIWLWSDPASFGHSPSCSIAGHIFIIGRRVPLASEGLRVWSLLIYILLVVPGLNLIPPIAFFALLYLAYERCVAPRSPEDRVWFVAAGLGILVTINVILLADIEATLANNPPPFLEPGDASWTFGQTLALLLLLVAARDIVETFLERRANELGEHALAAVKRKEPEAALIALKLGAKGSSDLLQSAIEEGYLDTVRYLVEKKGVVIPAKSLHYAAENGHLEIVQYLVEADASLDAAGEIHGLGGSGVTAEIGTLDRLGRTALHCAAANGHLEIAQYLVENQYVSINAKNHFGRTALDIAELGKRSDVEIYLRRHQSEPAQKEDSHAQIRKSELRDV